MIQKEKWKFLMLWMISNKVIKERHSKNLLYKNMLIYFHRVTHDQLLDVMMKNYEDDEYSFI